MIHPTAIIHESAKIADNVEIGPGAIIGANVEIDSGTSIGAYAVIVGPIKIGKDNQIFQFASVGEASQDRKYQDEETQTIIGERNMIREFCTVHRGTKQGGGVTRIGNDNVFMVGAHIAHDCQVGNSCTIANYSSLAGHVVMDDFVIM